MYKHTDFSFVRSISDLVAYVRFTSYIDELTVKLSTDMFVDFCLSMQAVSLNSQCSTQGKSRLVIYTLRDDGSNVNIEFSFESMVLVISKQSKALVNLAKVKAEMEDRIDKVRELAYIFDFVAIFHRELANIFDFVSPYDRKLTKAIIKQWLTMPEAKFNTVYNGYYHAYSHYKQIERETLTNSNNS